MEVFFGSPSKHLFSFVSKCFANMKLMLTNIFFSRLDWQRRWNEAEKKEIVANQKNFYCNRTKKDLSRLKEAEIKLFREGGGEGLISSGFF